MVRSLVIGSLFRYSSTSPPLGLEGSRRCAAEESTGRLVLEEQRQRIKNQKNLRARGGEGSKRRASSGSPSHVGLVVQCALVGRTGKRKIRPRRPRARGTFIHEMNAYAIRDARGRSHRFPRNSTATSREDKREMDGPVFPWPHRARTEIAEAKKNEYMLAR